jgi:hypothetical protein
MASSERINAALQALRGSRYLEIGVARGSTFFAVDAEIKVAVDPRFRFDPQERRAHPHETYHSVPSDSYIDQAIGRREWFDLIFLDGLHTYSQTLRDFLGTQALARPHTIWLLDDTVPSSAIAAEPKLSRVREARQFLGCADDEAWMGDVFKVVAWIDSFMPQYTCLTTEDPGQTFILPIANPKSERRFESMADIEQLNYVDALLLQADLLQPTPLSVIYKSIERLTR